MMMQLTIKRIRSEPVRVLFMVVAIAAVISVVLVLEGFKEGLYQQIRHIILSRGADVIVTQAGGIIKNYSGFHSTNRCGGNTGGGTGCNMVGEAGCKC